MQATHVVIIYVVQYLAWIVKTFFQALTELSDLIYSIPSWVWVKQVHLYWLFCLLFLILFYMFRSEVSPNFQAWILIQLFWAVAQYTHVVAALYLSHRKCEVLRFFRISSLFFSANTVLPNEFLVDPMVHLLHNWLNVVLEIFIVFVSYVEVKTLVVVARNNNSVFRALLVVSFIKVILLNLDCFIFNFLKASLSWHPILFSLFNLLWSVLT